MSQGPSELEVSARGPGGRQVITLKTEDSENIAGFLFANSLCPVCQGPTPSNDELMPLLALMSDKAPAACACNPPTLPGRHPVVTENECRDKELIICGAGPSLATFRPALEKFKGEIWGTNRALNYLHEWGITKAKGVAIDPHTTMIGEVWANPPDTDYLLATTVNPGLVNHLEKHGRPIRYFHSLRGTEKERYLYRLLYPDTCLAGRGLNVVNRALDLADYMGFSKIYIAGADNALGPDGELYADGSKMREGDVWLYGKIDKKTFATKVDMLMSATELVRVKKEMKAKGKRVVFLGRTLPAALDGKSEAFLKRVVHFEHEQ